MESRENSVLFSLNELRQIEEERISEEEMARREEEQQRIRAQQEAERRRLEEEQARIQAQQDAERMRLEEEERLRREDQMRIQEAEARARAEHQAILEQQRLAQEMALREKEIAKKRPTWLIAVLAGVVLIAGGFGYMFYQKAEHDRMTAIQEKRELEERIAALESEINTAQDALNAAEQRAKDASLDEAERKKAEEEAAMQRAKIKDLKTRRGNNKRGGGGKKDDKKSFDIGNIDDPL